MQQLHKILRACLACLLTLTILASGVSCATPAKPQETRDNPDTRLEIDTQESAAETEAESTRLLPDLPDVTFPGEVIHCLHWTIGSEGVGGAWTPWEEIATDILNGETINNAVFNRNSAVEEQYKVKITTEYAFNYEFADKILNAVSTGDDTYSFFVNRSGDIPPLWTIGALYDLRGNEVRYIDSTKPWWNQDSLNAFTFGTVTQFAASDILVLDKSETAVVFFSTRLQDDYGLENYYELVESGKWTWEALIRNAESCVKDLDGDLMMTAADQWGSCGNRAPGEYLYVGSGLKFADIDDEGHIFTEVGSEASIDLMLAIHDNILYAPFHANSDYLGINIPKKFMSNEIEFLFYSVKLANTLRNMESNYGILPIPKFDEYQTRYYDHVMPDGDSVLAIPISNENPSMTGLILEALSAESYYTVYPAFYDTIMMGKFARDPETRDMLKIVFDSRTYDIGPVHGLSRFIVSYATYAAEHHGDTGFASLYQNYAKQIQSDLDEINEKIDEWKLFS